MAKLPTPAGVQVTLADGSVLDYQTSLGDRIALHKVNTELKGSDHVEVQYYDILIIAREDIYDANTFD